MHGAGATLDMSLFFGTEDQKTQFCNEFLHMLKTHGCVKLHNHSISDDDVQQLFEEVCTAGLTSLRHKLKDLVAVPQVLLAAARDEDARQAPSSVEPQSGIQLRRAGECGKHQRLRKGHKWTGGDKRYQGE